MEGCKGTISSAVLPQEGTIRSPSILCLESQVEPSIDGVLYFPKVTFTHRHLASAPPSRRNCTLRGFAQATRATNPRTGRAETRTSSKGESPPLRVRMEYYKIDLVIGEAAIPPTLQSLLMLSNSCFFFEARPSVCGEPWNGDTSEPSGRRSRCGARTISTRPL